MDEKIKENGKDQEENFQKKRAYYGSPKSKA